MDWLTSLTWGQRGPTELRNKAWLYPAYKNLTQNIVIKKGSKKKVMSRRASILTTIMRGNGNVEGELKVEFSLKVNYMGSS